MPEIDQRERDVMKAETIGCFPFKADQQGLEFVNPGECALTDEASLVRLLVEMSFPSTFYPFSIPLVLRDVGNDATIPQQLAGCAGIEAAISIKQGAFIVQSAPLQIFEHVLQFLFKLKAVVVLSSDDARRGDDRTVFVHYREDITSFGFLAALIADAFAPFLAALWLPSRLSSDKFNSPRMETMLASKRRWRLPSLLHLRK